MFSPVWLSDTFCLTPFSVAVCIAAISGCAMLYFQMRRHRLNDKAFAVLPVIVIVFSLLCGHILYALSHLWIDPYVTDTPVLFVLNPARGGFMFLGVIIGAMLACLITSSISREPRRKLLNIVLPSILLMLAFIRFAEPLDGQGRGPEAMSRFFPLSFAPELDYPSDRYVPTFFYEGLYALCLAVIGIQKNRIDRQQTWLRVLILYLAGQVFFEVMRVDEYVQTMSMITFVKLNQLFAVIMLAVILTAKAKAVCRTFGLKRYLLCWAVFAASIGICIGFQFLLDKPLHMFGQIIFFPSWVVYIVLLLSAVGMGCALLHSLPRESEG